MLDTIVFYLDIIVFFLSAGISYEKIYFFIWMHWQIRELLVVYQTKDVGEYIEYSRMKKKEFSQNWSWHIDFEKSYDWKKLKETEFP